MPKWIVYDTSKIKHKYKKNSLMKSNINKLEDTTITNE